MTVKHWWNVTDMKKIKVHQEKPVQCHFGHHKSHIDQAVIEIGPLQWDAGDQQHELWHSPDELKLYMYTLKVPHFQFLQEVLAAS